MTFSLRGEGRKRREENKNKTVYVYKEHTVVDTSHEKLGGEVASPGLCAHLVIACDVLSCFQNRFLGI